MRILIVKTSTSCPSAMSIFKGSYSLDYRNGVRLDPQGPHHKKMKTFYISIETLIILTLVSVSLAASIACSQFSLELYSYHQIFLAYALSVHLVGERSPIPTESGTCDSLALQRMASLQDENW